MNLHDTDPIICSPLEKNDKTSGLPLFFIESKHWYHLDKGIIEVSDFETDFASIPSFVHWFANPCDPFIIRGAIIHDYLYEYKGLNLYNRKESDTILKDCCRLDGASRLKAYTVYNAVRVFGSKAWRT